MLIFPPVSVHFPPFYVHFLIIFNVNFRVNSHNFLYNIIGSESMPVAGQLDCPRYAHRLTWHI
jgi:hypothetical protein